MLPAAFGRGVADVEGLGEVLPQLVAGAELERLAVTHHAFAGVGGDRPGEALTGRLQADDHRDAEHVDHQVLVRLVHDPPGVRPRVVAGRVRGVPLLPEELAGAQEDPGAQLPADHVGPLVEQQREVAVGVDPLGHELADDGLAGGTHHDRLGELLAAAVGDDRELRREALDVLGLALEVALRDEQREVRVLRARRLDPGVHLGLHPFPDGVAGRADDHGPPDRAVVGQLRLGDQVLVPAGKVLRTGSEHACHDRRSYASAEGAAPSGAMSPTSGETAGAAGRRIRPPWVR